MEFLLICSGAMLAQHTPPMRFIRWDLFSVIGGLLLKVNELPRIERIERIGRTKRIKGVRMKC
jgi:hypothetical protein